MSNFTWVVKGEPGLLEEHEIYSIEPVSNLHELLRDGHSLCIAFQGEFRNGGYMLGDYESLRGIWHSPDGTVQKDTLLFSQDSAERQSDSKNRLDRIFSGTYVFCSWKKNGSRTFRLGQQSKTLAEYLTFDAAIAALVPGRFEPVGIYTRKYNWITMMGLVAVKKRERADLRRQLCDILRQRTEAPDSELTS